MLPLSNIRVIDFTTLVPGPLATLALAEAGADVLKIERPGGDEARSYVPKFGEDSGVFAMLNRGKRSLVLDLKTNAGLDHAKKLIRDADVLVEQFRPGVMERLGLGYTAARQINSRLIYCSISGYGQTGPLKNKAAHDLNYVAESGMLSLVTSADGSPGLPPALIADIGGGSYPAIMNVLMALLQRTRTNEGCYIDISMADNVMPFLYWAIAQQTLTRSAIPAGGEMTTGGTARYRIYQTGDGRYLAAAPIEDRFWQTFADLIGLSEQERQDHIDPAGTIALVADRIRAKSAADWMAIFSDRDACVAVVATIQEALASEQFRARGLFDRTVVKGNAEMVALPMPIADEFRDQRRERAYAMLGDGSATASSDWGTFVA
jgi:alpha-methylacyl-CoA racemase